MASDDKGTSGARKLHSMSADYGVRAAAALHHLLPGQHRAKAIQRMFDVSERTSKYLLAGQHWTMGRLSQASAVLGAAFDAALVSSDVRDKSEMIEIAERLARLEARFEEADRRTDAGSTSTARAAAHPEGRAAVPVGGVRQAGRDAD